jgi:hypothetical protein
MSTEQLIQDSIVVIVALDERNVPSRSSRIESGKALKRICNDRQADVVVLFVTRTRSFVGDRSDLDRSPGDCRPLRAPIRTGNVTL